jgi:flagellar protein FliJ
MANQASLDLVIHVSTDRRNGAALGVAGSRRQTEEAQRKLTMLSQYLNEYAARINGDHGTATTDPTRIANARAFVEKLEAAVSQQGRETAACQTHADACSRVLVAEERKLRSLELLREHRAREAGRAEGKREQKRTDEFAARAARNIRSVFDPRPV